MPEFDMNYAFFIIGVLLIFNGWGMINWVFILIGIALILDGAIALIKELQK